jgi:hypothetical protein
VSLDTPTLDTGMDDIKRKKEKELNSFPTDNSSNLIPLWNTEQSPLLLANLYAFRKGGRSLLELNAESTVSYV